MSTKAEHRRKWYLANRDRARAVQKVYYEANKGRYVGYTRARQKRVAKGPILELPGIWEKVNRLYVEARNLSDSTGVPHVVDHYWPLNHPLCCGLHVPWNLQVITQEANDRKGNSIPEPALLLDSQYGAW